MKFEQWEKNRKKKPEYQCKFLALHPEGKYALVIREDDHDKLGPPKDGIVSRTSTLLRVDFENGIIETLNSIYHFFPLT
jgi:hypothetical protein